MDKVVKIPGVIGGREARAPAGRTAVICDLFGEPALEVAHASRWEIAAAMERCSGAQARLRQTPLEVIVKVLARAMDHYFDEDWKFEFVAKMSGSPLTYVRRGVSSIKAWCRNLDSFTRAVFRDAPGDEAFFVYANSAPLVGILPGNSELESLYVIAQAILSRNAMIIRPSAVGAGAFTAYEFFRAFRLACASLDAKTSGVLMESFSAISTESGREFLSHCFVDGWNYALFGSDATIRSVTREIHDNCAPRKVIGYGTGLSVSIASTSADVTSALMDSIVTNVGNDCTSTDIVYCRADVFEKTFAALRERASRCKTGHPLDPARIGMMRPENFDFTYGELCVKRGKREHVCIESEADEPRMHASVIALNKYESTLEYPAPVAAIRPFADLGELKEYIDKDLKDNEKEKNLVTSVFCDSKEEFRAILSLLRTYTAKWNVPTHLMDMNRPHQGVFLLRELIEPTHIQYD